jgi:hypothetical protein
LQGHALDVRNLVAVLTMEDKSMVTTVIMAPALWPAATPAMATPLGTTMATTAVTGKADDVGQENDDRGGDDRDDSENNDKWGRGA